MQPTSILPFDPGHGVVHSRVYEEIEISFEHLDNLPHLGFLDNPNKGLFAANPRGIRTSGQCLDEKFFEVLHLRETASQNW